MANENINQIRGIYSSIPTRQRLVIATAVLAIAAGIWGFLHWQKDRNFRPLYSSLSTEDAAAVVQRLKSSNVEYRLGDNGTSVLVPSEKVAELRLDFASAGVPKSGRIGFELFDKTNFGMTEFSEHVNYRRALEGELERSIMSLNEVEHARVHLTFPKESIYTEARQPAKGSVLVKLKAGARLPQPSIAGITNLLASAVEGLAPEAVSVMDMHGTLLSRARLRMPGDESMNSEATLEHRDKIEKDVVAKINATLEPLVGAGKFRATASVDVDMTSGEESEETFDPEKSAVTTSQTTEDRRAPGSPLAGGLPGTASNLPRPPSPSSAAGDGNSHVTKQLTYQPSRKLRRTKLPQGGITRMSVAILLDEGIRIEGTGKDVKKVLVPVPPERIEKIQKLIAAAVGITPDRGDQLIVESMPFDSTLQFEPAALTDPASTANRGPSTQPAPLSLQWFLEPRIRMILLGTLAGVALFATLFVAWRRARARKSRIQLESVETGRELPPGTTETFQPAALPAPEANSTAGLAVEIDSRDLAGIASSRAEVLAVKLREAAKDDAEIYAAVLRGWLAEAASK
jgi:flagellar M-ring protein FliF